MENPRRKNSSVDKFSIPIHMLIPEQDAAEFEFGCVTPGTPSSPADRLFFNGKLLPHAFPSQPTTAATAYNYTRSSSRTSSVSSKDSLMSSRSNSTNSSSGSSCATSARTSTSTEASDQQRRAILMMNQAKSASDHQRTVTRDKYHASVVSVQSSHGGSSKRWQLIAPAPVLSHQVSNRKKAEIGAKVGSSIGQKKKAEDQPGSRSWFGWRFFRWIVAACIECHAMKVKPATGGCMLQGNSEMQQ